MPRPLVAPRFAGALRRARDLRRLTMGQVVARIHQAGEAFEGFTRAQLARYEQGAIAGPDPVVLLKLAQLYGVDVQAWIQLLLEDRLHQHDTRARGSPTGPRPARGARTGPR